MSSVMEAKTRAMLINAFRDVSARHTLEEMCYPQPACMPMQTNNLAANNVTTNNLRSKQANGIAIYFHWLCCREVQKQFCYYWRPGNFIWLDCVTKHHLGSHHNNVCLK